MTMTDAIISLASSSDAISQPGSPSTFTIFRSALKHADSLAPLTLPKILDSLLSAMTSELDATLRDLNLVEANDADIDRSVIDAHRTALDMYAFLILWLVGVGEKVGTVDEEGAAPSTAKARKTSKSTTAAKATTKSKKKSNSWTWSDQIPSVLSLLGRVLKLLPSAKVWTSTADRDSFIGYLLPSSPDFAYGLTLFGLA
jgi:condensin complex subunit 1